jgi:hypothetical protein
MEVVVSNKLVSVTLILIDTGNMIPWLPWAYKVTGAFKAMS